MEELEKINESEDDEVERDDLNRDRTEEVGEFDDELDEPNEE